MSLKKSRSALLDIDYGLCDIPSYSWDTNPAYAGRCQHIHFPAQKVFKAVCKLNEPKANRSLKLDDEVDVTRYFWLSLFVGTE